MKTYIVLFALVAAVTANFYDPKYDNFDVKTLMENDRILINYIKCFLDEGRCTPEARDFKKIIHEALETTCGKCSPKQKELIRKVVKAVRERHPEEWEKLISKYDKENRYRKSFEKFLREE